MKKKLFTVPRWTVVLVLFTVCIFILTRTTPAWSSADRVLFGLPGPISEEERATLGSVIGVTRGHFPPEVKFETYAMAKPYGALKGAAEGFLTGVGAVGAMGHGQCSGAFCGAGALIWIAVAATAGTFGAVYGAVKGYQDALPAAEAERIEQSVKRLLKDQFFQEQMADCLAWAARETTAKVVMKLAAQGPGQPRESVDYGGLEDARIGSILEVVVREVGFDTPPKGIPFDQKDPPLHLVIKIDVKLQRLSDRKILYNPTNLTVRSKSFRKMEWEADDSKKFLEQVHVALTALAEKVIEDVFVTIELPAYSGGTQ